MTAPTDPAEPSGGWQISLSALLPIALSALVILAVTPVIVVNYFIATDTVGRLLSQRADLLVDGLEREIRGLLDPVVAQLDYARRAVQKGEIDPRDPDAMRTFVLGMLAGTPQVRGVGIVREDLTMRRWERNGFAELIEPSDRLPYAGEAIEAARNGRSAYWAPPFVSPALGDTILNYRVALERDGELLGVLAAGVTSQNLSQHFAEASNQTDVIAFVLAGREHAVTYSRRPPPDANVTSTALPRVVDVDEPILARMWDDQRPLTQTSQLRFSDGHWSPIDDTFYVYLYRELAGYGPEPFVVGVALKSEESRQDRWTSTVTAAVGVVLMLIATAIAWRIGVVLSRPTSAIDGALKAIADLEFGKAALPHLVHSRVQEWRMVARRLQSTDRALSAFQTYLPRALVHRLFRASNDIGDSRDRDVTVMFLDLKGFTDFASGRSGADIAAYLNDLFARVGPVIEANGGVIDKYTGDGLLAFWGAPDAQPDHTLRACRAAAEIARVVSDTAEPGAPRVRIGLHTGPAIVGNIGFTGRIDYTLIGDTVNVAERVEASMHGQHPERPVVIGVTEAVFDAMSSDVPPLVRETPLTNAPQPAHVCVPTA